MTRLKTPVITSYFFVKVSKNHNNSINHFAENVLWIPCCVLYGWASKVFFPYRHHFIITRCDEIIPMGIDRIHVVLRHLNSMQNVCSVLCIDRGQKKRETAHWKLVKSGKMGGKQGDIKNIFSRIKVEVSDFVFFSHSIKFLRLHTKAPRKGRKKDNRIQLKSGTIRGNFLTRHFYHPSTFFSIWYSRERVPPYVRHAISFFGYSLCRIV